MTAPRLDAIRNCLEGYVPAVLATCDGAGVPNVSMVSQVHYVDPERVALSYQFFNKTRRNILENGYAAVSVYDPISMVDYRLDLDYEETRTEGPLFEVMKAKLAGIASHSGMASVFHLRGADIMRVRGIEALPSAAGLQPVDNGSLLGLVRRAWRDIRSATDLGDLFDRTLEALRVHFRVEHAMILMLDETGGRLYAVASIGYPRTGIGAEVAVGDGVIGVAVREAVPIRIGHMTAAYSYGAAIRSEAHQHGLEDGRPREIAYPGLAAPESQIALPIQSGERVAGVLFAESPQPLRFGYAEEDALGLVADQLAELIPAMQRDDAAPAQAVSIPIQPPGPAITVRHYQADDSVFLGHEYLIKGVAGAIFWRLVRDYAASGRTEFTSRELRLDPSLKLPAFSENLEARLVLLQRRLRDRGGPIAIERCGRGRLRLRVPGPLVLQDVPAGDAARTGS